MPLACSIEASGQGEQAGTQGWDDKRQRADDALAAEDARDGWQLVKWQEECEGETNREERLENHRAV